MIVGRRVAILEKRPVLPLARLRVSALRAGRPVVAKPGGAKRRARPVLAALVVIVVAGSVLVNLANPEVGAAGAASRFAGVTDRFAGLEAQSIDTAGYASVKLVTDDFSSGWAPVARSATGGSSTTTGSAAAPIVSSAPAQPAPSPGSAQAYAKTQLTARGDGIEQYNCLVALWNRESHWNVYAANPSGAYGIPQALPGSKMASAGGDWRSSYVTQVGWGLGYVYGRYGSPCGAWAHSQSTGWY